MNEIVIVGGGASGLLLAAQLLRQHSKSDSPLQLWIVEPNELGLGVAYSTEHQGHLLNVPAGRMSGWQDDMSHCFNWWKKRKANAHINDFIPRVLYGKYLRDLFQEAVEACSPKIQWAQVRSKAIAADRIGDRWVVKTADGQNISAKKIVLALGHSQPEDLPVSEKKYTTHPSYIRNPWSKEWWNNIEKNDSIFIIGSGLTAVDCIVSLFQQGHEGAIHSLSLQGLAPNAHRFGTPIYPSFFKELQQQKHPAQMLRVVRKHLERCVRHEFHWQAVIDCLRPNNQDIWQLWSEQERQAFVRHLAPYWNVARHRIAPEIEPILLQLQAQQQLSFLGGRITSIEASSERSLRVQYKERGTGRILSVEANTVLNCTGPSSDFSKVNIPVITQLLQDGWIRQDALKMGLDGNRQLQLFAADGSVSPDAYFIGPLTKSILWESIAIPEIRQQAQQLATALLEVQATVGV